MIRRHIGIEDDRPKFRRRYPGRLARQYRETADLTPPAHRFVTHGARAAAAAVYATKERGYRP